MTIDDGDNDSVALWSLVLEALRGVCPALAVEPEEIGASGLTRQFLPHLVNALDELGELTLILDDFHVLAEGPAMDDVAWFVGHAPQAFRLVISTRSDPMALQLATMRAHGELFELRADDLQFTLDEAELFLNGRLALGLSAADVAVLVKRTGGWPAGLYLAAMSLERASDRHGYVQAFDASSRAVVDYLGPEALDVHDSVEQTVLLRSSILERLSGPLCDAVSGHEGCGPLLRKMSRSNLFLAPFEDSIEWYRLHTMFAALLRVELEEREPGLVPTLHRRAYAWHRDNGTIREAIEHALKAAAFVEAAKMIARIWPRYLASGRTPPSCGGWLDCRMRRSARILTCWPPRRGS